MTDIEKIENNIKTDCFAYINRNGHKSCYSLNKLYCANEKCNFYKKCDYRSDNNIFSIQEAVKKYFRLKEVRK